MYAHYIYIYIYIDIYIIYIYIYIYIYMYAHYIYIYIYIDIMDTGREAKFYENVFMYIRMYVCMKNIQS